MDITNEGPSAVPQAKADAKIDNTSKGGNEIPTEPQKDPLLKRRVIPNPIIDNLNPRHLKRGVLIPLKTTQEVRQDHTIVQALITRAPTKSANDVLT